MSSSHERVRLTEQLQTTAPEVPQRPIRGLSSQPPPLQSHHPPPRPQPAVREIHKNAWLRRVSSTEGKKGASFRKCDKLWVVFCVHDDVEAFLEFYPDPKIGASHKPISHISLNHCQHVSSSIVGQDNEYQFAVTLPNQVIRLYAANWDQMMEWVESLQGKLREMNILSPKDNLYSKLPESRVNQFNATNYPLSFGLGLVSTRDPNSPLPPPPNMAGINGNSRPQPPAPCLAQSQSTGRGSGEEASVYVEASQSTSGERQVDRRGCVFSSNFNATYIHAGGRADGPGPSTTVTSLSSDYVCPGGTASFYVKPNPSSFSRDGSGGSDSGNGSGGSIISLEPLTVSTPLLLPIAPLIPTSSAQPIRQESLTSLSETPRNPPSVAVVVGNSNTTVVQVGCDETNLLTNNSSFTNITSCTTPHLEETPSSSATSKSSSFEPTPSTSTPTVLYSVVNKQNKQPQPTSRTTQGVSLAKSSSSCSSSNRKPPSPPSKTTATSTTSNNSKVALVNQAAQLISTTTTTTTTSLARQLSSEPLIQLNPPSSDNIYEHLFVAETTTTQPRINSKGANNDPESPPPIIPKRAALPRRLPKISSNSNRSSSLSRLEEGGHSGRSNGVREMGGGSDESTGNNGNNRARARRQDVVRGLLTPNGDAGESSLLASLEGRPMEAMIGVRSGEYRIRREELPGGNHGLSDTSQSSGSDGSTASATNALTNGTPSSSSQIPLKEQQVLRLKSEINHAGGVRVVLRKKDCLTSIAFVDYLGAVWIAGWKQQEHPVLYYAFHVGDQVLKVAGVTVQNSVEAYRAIKMVSSMQVEFIMRRLPYGKVLVLKRNRDGEPLGLVAIRNSGEIGEVVVNGLAATQGLPSKSPATDGKTNCNWFLTEVNNRPLSLLARENEVRDRLNAVGKEISILVQPADLVKHLRKNLKSLRGFKDYLIV